MTTLLARLGLSTSVSFRDPPYLATPQRIFAKERGATEYVGASAYRMPRLEADYDVQPMAEAAPMQRRERSGFECSPKDKPGRISRCNAVCASDFSKALATSPQDGREDCPISSTKSDLTHVPSDSIGAENGSGLVRPCVQVGLSPDCCNELSVMSNPLPIASPIFLLPFLFSALVPVFFHTRSATLSSRPVQLGTSSSNHVATAGLRRSAQGHCQHHSQARL